MNKKRLVIGLAGLLVLSGISTACSSADSTASHQHESGMQMNTNTTAPNLKSDVKGKTEAPTIEAQIKPEGRNATLTYTVKNFKLSGEHMDKAKVPNEGHLHVTVDNMEKAKLGEEKTIRLENLKAGKHKIVLSLQQNDHTPLGITKELEVEIKE
ncbi:hypothetical protein [Paenibacillus sp. KN14-4R]|uniref:hypothetical protein n=1 Tax=Paenibacillus sp. KN14-4R TaxID=3445773 RepID=UPI003F9EEFE5